jgi:hypothetical protein
MRLSWLGIKVAYSLYPTASERRHKKPKSHVALNRQNISFHLIRPVPRWRETTSRNQDREDILVLDGKAIAIPANEGKRRISWRGGIGRKGGVKWVGIIFVFRPQEACESLACLLVLIW